MKFMGQQWVTPRFPEEHDASVPFPLRFLFASQPKIMGVNFLAFKCVPDCVTIPSSRVHGNQPARPVSQSDMYD